MGDGYGWDKALVSIERCFAANHYDKQRSLQVGNSGTKVCTWSNKFVTLNIQLTRYSDTWYDTSFEYSVTGREEIKGKVEAENLIELFNYIFEE